MASLHTAASPETHDAYRRFILQAAAIAACLAVIGVLPTRELAGSDGLGAMAAAILAALVASAAGTVPVYLARRRPPQETVAAQLGAMALRLAVVLVLGVAVALSGLVEIKPFLLWLVMAHAALLVADTLFARSVVMASEAANARTSLNDSGEVAGS